MFELEIMITGYTLVVATTSVLIAKCVGRKKVTALRQELSLTKSCLCDAENEIKQLKIMLDKQLK